MQIQQSPSQSVPLKAQNGIRINPTTMNFWFDLGMLLLFLFAVASAFAENSIHPWMGTGMAAAVLIHLFRHRAWIKATVLRLFKPMPGTVRVKTVLNALLFIDFLLLTLSGGIVSLIYAPRITTFHGWCMYVLGGLLLLHLALNRKWLYSKIISVRQGNRSK